MSTISILKPSKLTVITQTLPEVRLWSEFISEVLWIDIDLFHEYLLFTLFKFWELFMLKYEEFSEKFELVRNFQKFLLEYFISE